MVRAVALIALLFALATPAAAVAQQPDPANPTQPFTPLPPAQPTPAPTPEPEDDGILDTEISGTTTLYVIAGALLIGFIAVGMFISRDARRALPAGHRPDSGRLREEGPHRRKREAKARARARGRAQKAARRRNR